MTSELSDARLELERLFPTAELSVELPFAGNGHMYQIRTSIGQEVFIGRAATREEAVLKCCTKAVKFVKQYYDQGQGRILAPHERKWMKRPQVLRDVSNNSGSYRDDGRGNSRNRRKTSPQKNGCNKTSRADEEKIRRAVRNRLARPERPPPPRAPRNQNSKPREDRNQNDYNHVTAAERKGGNDSGSATTSTTSTSSANPTATAPQFNFPYPAPTIIVTSEDCEDEYCEFLGEEKPRPNVPIKNAVMMLNELFPPPKAPQYKVTSQTGPPNNPTFTMVCTIDDR